MMGASDMGALPEFQPGYAQAEHKGLTLIEMVEAAHSEKMKAIFIIGINPIGSFPDTSFVKEALTKLDLLIVQDIFMTETAKLADFVLPAACWAETEGTFTSTGRRVQKLTRAVEPPGAALEGWRIIARLAEQLGKGELFRYNSWEEIFKEIVVNVCSYEGLTVDDVSRIGGAIIPKDRAELYENRFETENGRARWQHTKYTTNIGRESLPFTLTTGKILHHHGTGSMTRRTSFAMQEAGEPHLEISQEDLSALGLGNGDEVYVRSRLGEIRVKTKAARIKPKVVFLPFHFPDLSPNKLIPINLDQASKTPELKVIPVSISKAK
jgi:predicted molibdopterin-dependent oxidoreductase YjgC